MHELVLFDTKFQSLTIGSKVCVNNSLYNKRVILISRLSGI